MKNFSNVILDWYDENRRSLPWRESKDAYRIWLSEVILQQTRVAQGLPYYLNFIKTFHTVNDLAQAPEEAVLRLWQGLGYYSRARNLHKCAKVVSEQYNGVFPSTYDELLALPGIGPYTAAAIASIAFNRKVAVVDGNVYRVLARIFGIDTDISSTEGKKEFQELASRLINDKNPGDHNQAVMEFGATLCTPSPRCEECPFRKQCVAYAKGLIDKLPVKEKKIKKRTRYFYYFILREGNTIAMKKRTGRDIWNGLYEFYLIETAADKKLKAIVESDLLLKNISENRFIESGTIRHLLSHQELIIRFFEIDLSKDFVKRNDKVLNELSFVAFEQAEVFPKPVVISKYLTAIATKAQSH